MSTVSLTLTFASLSEAAEFLNAYVPPQAKITFHDRPDVGVSADEKAAVLAPVKVPDPLSTGFNPFAAQATPAAEGSAVVPVPPPPAPSTAVAEAPPTAPVAPPVTSAPTVAVPPAPPTVPAAAAPAAPAAPSSPAGIEVDADGLPWDARIHANSKEGKPKNADGRWRQRRGLNDAALKARVEAELRQAMGAAASVPVVPTVPAPPVAVPTAPAPAAPAASTTAAPPAPSEEAAPQFLARVGGMLASGALTQDRLNAALASAGLSTMAQLIVAPALIPVVRAQIDAV